MLVIQGTIISAEHVSGEDEPLNLKEFIGSLDVPVIAGGVVDYKTAATSDPTELDRRVEGYRTQGASYALTVARSTGEPVARVVFCFLTPDGVVERDLVDLAAAVAEVEDEVRTGREVEADRASDVPVPS